MRESDKIYSAGELSEIIGGQLIGDSGKEISGVAGVLESTSEDITFAESEEYLHQAEKSAAGVIIVPETIRDSSKTVIAAENPRLAYARVAALFVPDVFYKPGIHPSAVISDTAVIGNNVSIHPKVVVDDAAEIGDNTILAPGVYVGKGVRIGQDCIIHPNVVIEYDSVIGSNVIIHAGTVIGSDGYGFVTAKDGHHKIPQLGNVIIENDVEIGSNVSVDRGTSGPTVIGRGSKIDNLVQIAHNVKVGPECLIIAQVGIAGSAELGRRVIIAGKSGVVGHVKVGNNVTIANNSIITKNTPDGVFYSGIPAHDHKAELREQAGRRKLPDLLKKIREMEKKINQLERNN